MRIAYYSLDEVNRLLVRQWGSRQGVRVTCPGVATIGDRVAASMIVDLDFLLEPIRGNWLKQAIAGAIEGPVLVHGHGLSDDEARGLTRRGMTVCQGRLRRQVFHSWVAAMSDSEVIVV
jgi:hypothetical protein